MQRERHRQSSRSGTTPDAFFFNNRKNKKSRQIVFEGEELDMQAVWRLRDEFFPPGRGKAR